MDDWSEIEGDEWGPIHFQGPFDGGYPLEAFVDLDVLNELGGPFLVCQGAPVDIACALLRAHRLRWKAPGTECGECRGTGQVNSAGDVVHDRPAYVDCDACWGTGRDMDESEIERWRKRHGGEG